jgi:hypothetical protein
MTLKQACEVAERGGGACKHMCQQSTKTGIGGSDLQVMQPTRVTVREAVFDSRSCSPHMPRSGMLYLTTPGCQQGESVPA